MLPPCSLNRDLHSLEVSHLLVSSTVPSLDLRRGRPTLSRHQATCVKSSVKAFNVALAHKFRPPILLRLVVVDPQHLHVADLRLLLGARSHLGLSVHAAAAKVSQHRLLRSLGTHG